MDEFDVIARYLRPLTEGRLEALDLRDDAALLGDEWVITTDTMEEGVHLFGWEQPADLAKKLLRVNLSDLAAKGASPYCYFLNLALPKAIGGNWIAAFSEGLRDDQQRYEFFLAGGDTTNTQAHMSLGVTAIGKVSPGKMLRRSGGRPRDDLYVSGTLGDSTLGLALLKGETVTLSESDRKFLIDRYLRPEPRVALGVALCDVAHACIDISDGLAQDLSHVCHASQCGANISVEAIPLSAAASVWLKKDNMLIGRILSGGDDYELLFSAPPETALRIQEISATCGVSIARIGQLTETPGIVFLKQGIPMALPQRGYQHQF